LVIGKCLGYLLNKYTDASYANFDSLLLAASVLASILSAKLFVENWYVWIVVNISYVLLYIIKDAYLTAILYAVLLVIAVIGLRDWKKQVHA
jgi:nicotinamide mononucleotide transporter